MFAWGAVLVWGEIGGTVCKGHTACHQGHAAWANILARRISIRKFPTVPSQNLIYPLCLVETMQGREKVAEKEMQQMQQDKREAQLPQLSMDVDNPKLSRSSLPLTGIISLVNSVLHPVLKRQSHQSQRDSRRC
ncbi:hypothetical protein BU17DRAFT_72503 [Hysterangium stoloniferum]|nr:hypothetical protein BU17DRAFT_72503 [Hysterangium stoloniferum]